MASDSVLAVLGVGPKAAAALKNIGVTTVGQLAKLEPGRVGIPNLSKIIYNAEEYIRAKGDVTPPAVTDASSSVSIGSGSKKKLHPAKISTLPAQFSTKLDVPKAKPLASVSVPPPPPPEEASATEEASAVDRFLVSDHTWWEARVTIPRLFHADGTTQHRLCEAIVYELVIDPTERVAFMCSWVESDRGAAPTPNSSSTREKLLTMTYSPQILLHFNVDLPPLSVSITREDFDALPNQHTIRNVFWEVEVMQEFMAAADPELP